MNRLIFLLVFVFCSLSDSSAYNIHKQVVKVYNGRTIQIAEGHWDGLVLVFDGHLPKGIVLRLNGISFPVVQDPHHSKALSQTFTFPLQSEISLFSETWTGECTLILVHAGTIPLPKTLLNKKEDLCEKPSVIPPSIWRNGLPEPLPERDRHDVNHLVVHHTAGSNTNTDYVAVVRSIYLLHLETNGWDDIGYNYLISPDGQIFIGRDPLEELEEDEVRGAHFCSKNTGTMGVGILGTYSESDPTEQSLQALSDLLLWKLVKENIHPQDSYPHPLPNDEFLKAVCGHRDGCATDCPGDRLYALLSGLRSELIPDWHKCVQIAQVDNRVDAKPGLKVYPNPFREDIISIQWPQELKDSDIQFSLTDLQGRYIGIKHEVGTKWRIEDRTSKGVYFLHLETSNFVQSIRLLRL